MEFVSLIPCMLLGALLVRGVLSVDSVAIEESVDASVMLSVLSALLLLLVLLVVVGCSVDADTLQVTESQLSQFSWSKIYIAQENVFKLRFVGTWE